MTLTEGFDIWQRKWIAVLDFGLLEKCLKAPTSRNVRTEKLEDEGGIHTILRIDLLYLGVQ